MVESIEQSVEISIDYTEDTKQLGLIPIVMQVDKEV